VTVATAATRRAARRRGGSIIERVRGEHALRIVPGCYHACFTCDRFVARGGGCPGVAGDDANADLPVCHSRFAARRRRVEAHARLFDRFCRGCGRLDRMGEHGCAGLAVRYDETPVVEELMACFAEAGGKD